MIPAFCHRLNHCLEKQVREEIKLPNDNRGTGKPLGFLEYNYKVDTYKRLEGKCKISVQSSDHRRE